MGEGFVTNNAYNRFVNLDNIEWHLIDYLMNSESKYAEYLWKILKYDTPDCLSQPALTKEEKMSLVYTGNGDSTKSRVFMSPFIDDSWEVQSSHLHIYVDTLKPNTYVNSYCQIGIECIIHNKIANIYGDASEYNPNTNPDEMRDGEFLTPYKSRASVMLKSVMADLNGRYVNGVGTLMFSKELGSDNEAKMSLWNSKKFFGYKVVLSTMISGVSDDADCGY